MDEQQVRALVREALARHLGVGGDGSPSRPSPRAEAVAPARPLSQDAGSVWKSHLSHGRFVYLAPVEPDSPCVVEPHVRCHHCGFCQSYGH